MKLMTFTLIYCVLFFGLGVKNSLAEELDLGDGIKVTTEQLKKIEEELPKISEDKYFFHWTSKKTGLRWINQGKLEKGEVDFLSKPTGDRQAFGPGVYLAENPTSSQHFGEYPVSFKIKKGTPLYDSDIVEKVLGKKISHEQASILGSKIPFVRHTSQDWYVMNHVQNATEIKYAYTINNKARLRLGNVGWDIFNLLKELEEIERPNNELIRLKKLITLTDYMDGISFYRALKINPSSPWNEFEPEKFESYSKQIIKLKNQPEVTLDFTANRGVTLEERLSRIYSTFSEIEDKGLYANLRNEGIRVGGDFNQGYFSVSERELKNLEANPYLEVVVKEKKDGKYLIEYFYPDAFHYKKLKGKISDELYNTLIKQDPDFLFKNHELRRDLNKKLISELIQELSARTTDVYFKVNSSTMSFMRDLISIHPFSDYNGRTIRALVKLDIAQTELYAPLFMISDNDLLLSPEEQVVYLEKTQNSYKDLVTDMLDEYSVAMTEKRVPNYAANINLQKLLNESLPILGEVDLDNKTHRELIRGRRWSTLISMVSDEGIKNLEINLKDSSKRASEIKKLLEFNETVILQLEPSQQTKFAHIILNELKSEITQEHVRLLRKYENLYQLLNDKDLLTPTEVQKNIVDKIISDFGNPKLNAVERRNFLEMMKILEKDKLKLLKDYYNISVQFENIRGIGAVDKFEYDILNYFQLSLLQKDSSVMDNFIEIVAKICKQNLKLGVFDTIEKFGAIKPLIQVSGLSLEQSNKIIQLESELKDGFKEVILQSDQATKLSALTSYAKIAPENELLSLISDKRILKSDTLTRDAVSTIVVNIMDKNRFLPNPDSVNIPYFRRMVEGLSSWIDAKIESGYLKGLGDLMYNYQKFYKHYMGLGNRSRIFSTEEINQKFLNKAIEIFKNDSRILKLETIYEVKKSHLSDSQLIKVFDEGFFGTPTSFTRSETMEDLYNSLLRNFEQYPNKFVELSSAEKVDFLKSLNSLAAKDLPKEYHSKEFTKKLFAQLFSISDDETKAILTGSSTLKPNACNIGSACKCILDSLNELLK